MKNNTNLNIQLYFLNNSGQMKFEPFNGIETKVEKKSQLEVKISKTVAYIKKLPVNKQEKVMRRKLDKIISEDCRNQANNELLASGISVDQQSSQIDKMLAPKKEYSTPLDMICYTKSQNWSQEYENNIEARIKHGNEARNILRKGDILSFPPDILAELAEIIYDGESASWIYINKNLGLAVSEAKEFAKKNNALGDCGADIMQESIIAMFEAMRTYDESKGSSMSTFGTLVVKRRLPRFGKKYVTLFHVSEEDYKEAFEQYRLEKRAAAEEKKAEEAKREEEKEKIEMKKKSEFEILTTVDSLDAVINEDGMEFHENIPDLKIGDPAEIVAEKSFKAFIWNSVYNALLEAGYSKEWMWMYRRIVIDGCKPVDYAEQFGVTERTIRNRIHKMSETIRIALTEKQEGFIEMVGYAAHQDEKNADAFSEEEEKTRGMVKKSKTIEIRKVKQVLEPSDSDITNILPVAG